MTFDSISKTAEINTTMARHEVIVNIPLEVDYTNIKKDAVCKVYFANDTAISMICHIDGRHFTPKSVDDDLAIMAIAKELYNNGKFAVADEPKVEVKEYTNTNHKNKLHNKANGQKTNNVSKKFRSLNYDLIKNLVKENNGKLTMKDISDKLNVSTSAVQSILRKLNATKIRDINYKWKGRRYFVAIDF